MVKQLGPFPSKGGRTELQANGSNRTFPDDRAARGSGGCRQPFKNSVTIALNCSGACSNIQ
jgi:hypothetical protein